MAEPRRRRQRGERVSVTRRRVTAPLPARHFRVFLDREEIGMLSVGPLHWLVEGQADPELRQTVTLRRAVSQDRRLYDWYGTVAKGKEDVRELTIVQLDCPSGTAVNIWRLEKATPVRWTGPGFNAVSDDFAAEELEVRYASIAWRSSL